MFRTVKPFLAVPLLAGLCAAPAHAQLVINPTYDSSITSDPNAAAIEQGIQNAINVYETTFTNNVTVNITFESVNTGLGLSSTYINTVNYLDYANALHANEPGQSFLTSVPIQPNNPVNNSTQVTTTLANLRTLGFSGYDIASDSTISLNTGLMNLSRSGTQDPNKYDLKAVASHEIDEVLGLGSALDNLATGAASPTGPIGSLDLFRYDASGSRSFTTSPTAVSFFSATGGTTDVVGFNQNEDTAPGGFGGDFHDWFSTGTHTPQVQDAYGSPGTQIDLGNSEITALQAVGYNLAAAPEPSEWVALVIGALCLGTLVVRARRRAA